jgi:predicted ester cyclase
MRRTPLKAAVVALSIVAAACANTVSTTEMAEQNVALVKRATDESWNQKNFANAAELYAADFVSYSQGIKDTTTVEQRVKALQQEYPDFSLTIDDAFATTDRVATRWTFKGTNKATGKAVAVPGVTVSRVVNGKIAEQYGMWDSLAPTLAMGFTLTPPATK